jgi:hypothetical protein
VLQKALLVPMKIHAWMVDNSTLTSADLPTSIRRWQHDYTQLSQFHTPESPPFSNETHTAKQGIYLSWELPNGLRHGQRLQPTDPLTFPRVPNRWLVVRNYGPAGQRIASAWIVESNFLQDPQGASFPGPQFPDPQKPAQVWLGRQVPLAQWQETAQANPAAYLRGLTAVANGDITFSAYQPYHINVFSFYDALLDSQQSPIDQTTVSYFVTGWYADRYEDPMWFLGNFLHRAVINAQKLNPETSEGDLLPQWFGKLHEDYQWQIPELEALVRPDNRDNLNDSYASLVMSLRTLCHGMATAIPWERHRQEPLSRPNPINPAAVKVAVGNTALSALTALLAAQETTTIPPLLLRAFQEGFLQRLETTLDGQEELTQQCHQNGFSPFPGGTSWVLVKEGDQSLTPDKDTLAVLPSGAIPLLNEVNAKQFNLDTQRRLLKAWQWELYALWWKQGQHQATKASGFNLLPDEVVRKLEFQLETTPEAENFFNRVKQQQQLIARLEQALNQAINDLTTWLPGHTPPQDTPFVLKAQARSSFWQPEDPVVLITGLPSPKEDNAALLPCRYSEQIVKTVSYSHVGSTDPVTLSTNQVTMPAMDLSQLTSVITGLWQEFCLFDTAALQAIPLSQLQPGHSQQLPVYGLGVWSQSWQPLFMDWEINWYRLSFNDWHFDGERYVLEQPAHQATAITPQTIKGRTFLTTQASFAFKARLKQLVQQSPELVQDFQDINLNELLAQIEQWDVLSQFLSGLHEQFILRDIRLNRIPTQYHPLEQPFYNAIQGETHNAPLPGIPPHRSFFSPVSFLFSAGPPGSAGPSTAQHCRSVWPSRCHYRSACTGATTDY